jgi:PAS domain S-box-containing protein
MKPADWFPTSILIVDDKQWVRDAMRDRIARSSEHFLVATAESGAVALELADRTSFDVVLCDLLLGGGSMDGIEVTKQLRVKSPITRVIVFAGQSSGDEKKAVLQAGAFSYLSKPIDYEELLHGIRTINSIRRREQLGDCFKSLSQISYDLQSSLKLRTLARQIVEGARELGYQRARLYLLEGDTQTLVGLDLAGGTMLAEDFAKYHIALTARPIIGAIFNEDRPLIWNKKEIIERFGSNSVEPWMTDFDLHKIDWIDCPLFVQTDHIGNLAVDHHGRPDLLVTEDDLQIMGVLAGLAAQALKKARLSESDKLANASLRSILQDAPDAVITTDMLGIVNFVSPSCQRLLGYEPQEMVGRSASSFYVDSANSPGAGEEVARLIMRRLRSNGPFSNERIHIRVKDGFPVPLSLSANMLHDDNNKKIGTLGILRDLRMLEAQSQRYRDLLEGFGYGTLLLKRDAGIVFINRKASRLLQMTREQAEGCSFVSLISPSQRQHFKEVLQTVLANGSEASLDLTMQRSDHSRIVLEVRLTPTRSSLEALVDGVALALYDRAELSALIQSARLMTLGQLVAGVGHEINNPLNHMLLAAREVEGQLRARNALESADRECFEIIERNAQRITRVLHIFRGLARPAEFRREPLSIGSTIEDSLVLFRRRFDQMNISIESFLPDDLPLVLGDASRLQQVFVNLLTNAEDAMEGQSEPKSIRIDAALEPEGRLLIAVSDTGKGVSEELRETIFDPFFTTKAPSKGTGLGLSVSRAILDLHDGQIEVRSNPAGRGTSFVVTLPLAGAAFT